MNQSVINYNQAILDRLKRTYPNLSSFSYDEKDDTLVYNGMKASLSGYGLSRIDSTIFLLAPDDIFRYFKNRFYEEQKHNVEVLFNKPSITEFDMNTIMGFNNAFKDKCLIFANNPNFFSQFYQNEEIRNFVYSMIEDKKIIDKAKAHATSNGLDASSLIWNFYQRLFTEDKTTFEKVSTLSRMKPGFGHFDDEYQNEKIGVAGFTSILLIIVSVLAVGMFLAINLLN